MRVGLAIALFVYLNISVEAQLKLDFNIGYSSSKQGDLTKIQDNIKNEVPLPIKTVNSFDPSVYYLLSANYHYRKHYLGGYFQTKTTGARSGLSDTTGHYQFDQLLKQRSFGMDYRYGFMKYFSGGLRIGATRTKDLITEELKIFETVLINNEIRLKARGKEINPYLKMNGNITQWLTVNAEVGYTFDSSKKLMYDHQKTTVKPNWSGYRISAGLTFSLF